MVDDIRVFTAIDGLSVPESRARHSKDRVSRVQMLQRNQAESQHQESPTLRSDAGSNRNLKSFAQRGNEPGATGERESTNLRQQRTEVSFVVRG